MKKRFNRLYFPAFFLVLILVACFVTACGGGGSKSSVTETTAAAFDAAAYNSAPAAGIPGTYAVAESSASYQDSGMDGGYYDSNLGEEYKFEEEMAIAEPMAAPAPASMENGTAMGPDTSAQESSSSQNSSSVRRKLIRTISLNVETTAFDDLLSSIQSFVTTGGGYIEQSDVSGTSVSASPDRRRYAYLTVRIPSGGLDNFLSQMAEKSNVINRSENVQDVTLQYTDIESRKKSLTIEQERLWALLEKADTLEAVIALEERLSEIRYELEGFESQLRVYDNQVDYSTVHISIQEVGVFTPTAPDSVVTRIQKGFVRNLENVVNDMTDFIVWFLSHLPSLIMLALIIGILFLIGMLFRRNAAQKQVKADSNRKRFFKAPGKTEKTQWDKAPQPGITAEENAAKPDSFELTKKED